MREILFRGKRLDGAWETGSLVRWHLGLSDERAYIDDMAMYNTPVDAKTVGQYIGLCDKNGQKIFEGDIVRRDNKNFNISYVESLAQFIAMDCQHTGYPMPLTSTSVERMEVVGNIWDNPELTVGGGNTMNKQDKPLSEWTLGELKDCCNGVSCDECPVGNYEDGLCQFGDCTPDKWDFLIWRPWSGTRRNTGNTPAETAPAPEPETDKPAKPRLAEVLGVEVGEEFALNAFGKEVNFSVHEDGTLWQGDNPNITAACLALIINCPERIIRKPRLTERELAICRAVGAKWVTRDTENYVEEGHVLLWKEKPELSEGIYGRCETGMVGMILDESGLFTKSVRPGECIAVEEASKLPEWISVKDRLPDIGDEVILAVKVKPDSIDSRWVTKAFPCQGQLNTDDHGSPEFPHWEWCTEDGFVAVPDDREVTHWRPLPEPPEEECKDGD